VLPFDGHIFLGQDVDTTPGRDHGMAAADVRYATNRFKAGIAPLRHDGRIDAVSYSSSSQASQRPRKKPCRWLEAGFLFMATLMLWGFPARTASFRLLETYPVFTKVSS